MGIFSRILRPNQVASAHCDGPCGVYDPASARIAAEAVLSMTKKLKALGHDHDVGVDNTKARFVVIKEEQAEIAKRELDVLWNDYFKPEHLQQYPDLWETFWKGAKLCSKTKQEVNEEACEELMQTIEKVHNIFWKTKNRDVPFYRAG